MSNYTEAWAEQQANPSSNILELFSIEFIHPVLLDDNGGQTSIRALNDVQDRVLPLEDTAPLGAGTSQLFTAIPFEVPWFDTEEGKVPELAIRVDNIGRELLPYMDAMVGVDAPLIVIFRCHLLNLSDGTLTAGMDPVQFSLRSVEITEQYVQGTASPADLVNLQFPLVIYDIQNYPALMQ